MPKVARLHAKKTMGSRSTKRRNQPLDEVAAKNWKVVISDDRATRAWPLMKPMMMISLQQVVVDEKKKPQTLLTKTGGQPRKRTQGEPVVRVLSLSSSPLRGKDGQEYAGPGDELG